MVHRNEKSLSPSHLRRREGKIDRKKLIDFGFIDHRSSDLIGSISILSNQ